MRLTLHCRPQEERPPYHRYKKGGSVGGVCYLSMGMVVLLMGLVFASVHIYGSFFSFSWPETIFSTVGSSRSPPCPPGSALAWS